MSDIKISLESSGSAGAISVVRVDGVIDTMTAPDLEKVMNTLLEQRKYNIIIDLGGVEYISSAGWGIFISNIREIRQNSGDIKLARMIPNVYEIFELLEFDSILRAFDSIEKAKSDFAGAEVKPANINIAGIEASVPEVKETKSPSAAVSSAPPVNTAVVEKEKSIARALPKPAPLSLRVRVLEMIAKDPFFTISEIKREIRRKHSDREVGWWKIWNILRRENLLSKRNRFRRARIKSGSHNE